MNTHTDRDRNTDKDRIVTAIFHDRHDADRAYSALLSSGVRADDISVVMSEDTRKNHYKDKDTEMGNKAAEGAGVGGAVGGTIGGILGAIAAAAAPIVFPGVGIVLSGPLAAALAGAGAGGLGGSLLGGLIGAGIPEERVKHYEEGIKQGGVLIGVHTHSEAEEDRIESILSQHDGRHT